jgi:hypothetical protein
MEIHATYCPALIDCKMMTGVINNCPNLEDCLVNSRLSRNEAMRLYFLNKGADPKYIRAERTLLKLSNTLEQYIPTDKFTYNPDFQTRDNIIFGQQIDWKEVVGGANFFENLTLDKLFNLIKLNFANIIHKHNEAPSIGEFFTFAEIQAAKGNIFTFEGYAIMPQRYDYRVSIDGTIFNGSYQNQLLEDFGEFVAAPDELSIEPNYLRAWWD